VRRDIWRVDPGHDNVVWRSVNMSRDDWYDASMGDRATDDPFVSQPSQYRGVILPPVVQDF